MYTESNKLIAEFMGAISTDEDHTCYNDDGSIKYTSNEDGSKWIITTWSRPEGFSEYMYRLYGWGSYMLGKWLYHEDWSWLMTVVDKIESIVLPDDNYPNVTIGATSYCTIQDANGELFEFIGCDDTKLTSTYSAVVGFIKWYNKHV